MMTEQQQPNIQLKIVHRDIRVSRGIKPIITPEHGLAYDIASRYLQAWARWSGLRLVYHQMALLAATNPVYRQTLEQLSLQFAPHFTFNLAADIPAVEAHLLAASPVPQSDAPRSGYPPVRQIIQKVEQHETEQITQRLYQKVEKILTSEPGTSSLRLINTVDRILNTQHETTERHHSHLIPVERFIYRQQAQESARSPFKEVSRTLRRPPAPAQAANTRAESMTDEAAAVASRHGAWPLPAAPAVDVNRLTEQVIQTLDRRLVAHRERLGRI